MPIDLPPLQPPQAVSEARIEQWSEGRSLLSYRLGVVEIQLSGDHGLSAAELGKVFAAADSVDSALQLLNAAIARRGRLLVSLHHARDAGVLKVHCLQGRIAEVSGPSAIRRFFLPLKAKEALTRAGYERARLLAELQAGRLGRQFAISYRIDPANPEAVSLQISDAADKQQLFGGVTVGNFGSRFAGRGQIQGDVRAYTDGGLGLSFGYATAVESWGENFSDGDGWRSGSLAISGLFNWSWLQLGFSESRFRQDLMRVVTEETAPLPGPIPLPGTTVTREEPVDIGAASRRLELTAEQLLYARRGNRLWLREQVGLLENTREDKVRGAGPLELDENHGVAGLGLVWDVVFNVWNRPLTMSLGSFWRSGFEHGDDGSLDQEFSMTAQQQQEEPLSPLLRTASFNVTRPELNLRWQWSPEWALRVDAIAQIGSDRLPEQQQWVLGGLDSLSAWLPGVMSGDSGSFFRVEVTRNWFRDDYRLSLSAFAEQGSARFENLAEGLTIEDRVLADAGLRLQLDIAGYLLVDAVMASPMTEKGYSSEFLDNAAADFLLRVSLSL